MGRLKKGINKKLQILDANSALTSWKKSKNLRTYFLSPDKNVYQKTFSTFGVGLALLTPGCAEVKIDTDDDTSCIDPKVNKNIQQILSDLSTTVSSAASIMIPENTDNNVAIKDPLSAAEELPNKVTKPTEELLRTETLDLDGNRTVSILFATERDGNGNRDFSFFKGDHDITVAPGDTVTLVCSSGGEAAFAFGYQSLTRVVAQGIAADEASGN